MSTKVEAHVTSTGLFFVILIWGCLPVAAPRAEPGKPNQSVHFRDLKRSGSAAIIGHFGLPIGQTVKLEGIREKPSKVSNGSTLRVRSVNDEVLPTYHGGGWPPLIQISNIYELPQGVTVVLEGYEFAVWRGSAEKNWHMDVDFMVTRVIGPESLELDVAPP